jgi:predicted methyltransferase
MTRPCFRYCLLFVTICLGVFSVSAQQHSVRPGINRHYEDPDWQHWVRQFESAGREVYDRRFEVLNAAGVKPGMAVADIGAGTGLYTRLLSPLVGPQGKVYAVDIARNFIDNIVREARAQKLNNIEGIVNTDRDAGLAPNSIDLVLTVDTYHHFEYPQDMLASIHQALRTGGRLIVIDFRKHEHASRWVQGHVRADRHSVIDEISAAGFRLIDDKPILSTNYYLEFEKPEPDRN